MNRPSRRVSSLDGTFYSHCQHAIPPKKRKSPFGSKRIAHERVSHHKRVSHRKRVSHLGTENLPDSKSDLPWAQLSAKIGRETFALSFLLSTPYFPGPTCHILTRTPLIFYGLAFPKVW